jgi:hypothetical protein
VVFQPEEAQLSALHCHLELDMILSPVIIDFFLMLVSNYCLSDAAGRIKMTSYILWMINLVKFPKNKMKPIFLKSSSIRFGQLLQLLRLKKPMMRSWVVFHLPNRVNFSNKSSIGSGKNPSATTPNTKEWAM